MDPRFLVKLEDICTEVRRGLGMISVVEDALDIYTQHNTMTEAKVLDYINALVSTENVLSEVHKKLQDMLDSANTSREKE